MSSEESQAEEFYTQEQLTYMRHINADDPLQIILRGHLYVEANLITLISQALPNPQAIEIDQLRFPVKLNLATALNLLQEEERPAYERLNRLRNRFAHNVNTEITRQDELDFFDLLTPAQQSLARVSANGDDTFPNILRASITALYLDLEEKIENLQARRGTV